MQAKPQQYWDALEEYKALLLRRKQQGKMESEEAVQAYKKERNRLYNKIRYFDPDIRKVLDARKRDWFGKNAQRAKEKRRLWVHQNRVYVNEYRRNKIKSDHSFRIHHNLRIRLNEALRLQKKSRKFSSLIGISLIEFRSYIEKQFCNGMSWENYGDLWHIDHIVPCRKFDHTIEEEKKKCWHYTNMRPLLAEDNFKKNMY